MRMRWLPFLAFLLLIGCATAKPKPVVTFDMLSPAEQERIKPLLGDGDPSSQWWKIVQQACANNALANCVCCQATAVACNPGNWDCCSSAVFPPADGNECAFTEGCACSSSSPNP